MREKKASIKSILINGNIEKNGSDDIVNALIHYLNEKGIDVLLSKESLFEGLSGDYQLLSDNDRPDLCVVIGGDGTVLASIELIDHSVPILAINKGSLGFITEICPEEVFSAMEKVLNHDYSTDARLLLRLNFQGETFYALNDAVVTKGAFPGIAEYDLYINEEYFSTIRSDGIIISTPTGSTAYSLSCFGPILQPGLEALIINFICPHSLSLRPLLVKATDSIKIKARTKDKYMMINADGRIIRPFSVKDTLVATKAPKKLTFLRVSDFSFFQVVQKKLYLAAGGRKRHAH